MKPNIMITLLAVLFVASAISYTEVEHQDEHFSNIHAKNYVLAVFLNPKKNGKLTQSMKSILEGLEETGSLKDTGIVVELIDTVKLPFFDSHYDLHGSNALRFFIKGQMIDMPDFDKELDELYRNSIPGHELATKIEDFIAEKIDNISIELSNIQEFKEMLQTKRIVGLYSGADNINFERFFHVARKNIDFNFAHTFDPKLKNEIYTEFGHTAPSGDIFGVFRYAGDLNEFDDQVIVTFSNFEEKALMEFIEFERFDKLRGPEHGNDIFKRMIHKSEPLVLFVKDKPEESWRFQVFKSAVKDLPKKLIYSHVDGESPYVGSYHQMFMLSNTTMIPETLYVLWFTPIRKIWIEQYKGNFNREDIIAFVDKIYKEQANMWDSMRSHLYDHNYAKTGAKITSEEL